MRARARAKQEVSVRVCMECEQMCVCGRVDGASVCVCVLSVSVSQRAQC